MIEIEEKEKDPFEEWCFNYGLSLKMAMVGPKCDVEKIVKDWTRDAWLAGYQFAKKTR